MEKSNYTKLLVTLIVSFFFMYSIMYLNVDAASHIYLNMTRFYMTVLMVSAMAVVMILMMPGMYANKKKNGLIILSSAVVFLSALAGVRMQVGVGDVQYMKGMIPHHSIAIMTSSRADIKDPRVRKLANGILETQVKEIAQMKALIDSLEHGR